MMKKSLKSFTTEPLKNRPAKKITKVPMEKLQSPCKILDGIPWEITEELPEEILEEKIPKETLDKFQKKSL